METPQEQYCQDEIDLYQLFVVLAKRKRVVIATCVLFTLVSLAAALLITPKYKISAIVKPGITGFDKDGNPVSDLTPVDLKTWVNSGAYEPYLYSKFGDKAPKVRASISRRTNVVQIYTYYPDPEKGKGIIREVISLLKSGVKGKGPNRIAAAQKRLKAELKDLERRLQRLAAKKRAMTDKINSTKMQMEVVKGDIEDKRLEIENIKRSIRKLEQDKKLILEDIKTLERTTSELEKKLSFIDKNTADLIKQRLYMIKAKTQDKLSLLIFSNIIQDNLVYASNLALRISDIQERIVSKKGVIHDKDLQIDQLKNKIKSIQIEIDTSLKKRLSDLAASLEELRVQRDEVLPRTEQAIRARIEELKERMNLLSPVEVVQDVFSSVKPVKPKKRLIVAVGLVSGLFLGIFLAFFVEYLDSARRRYEEDTTR